MYAQLLDLGTGWTWAAMSMRAIHLIGMGMKSLGRPLPSVFVFGIDVVMLNIPIPLRQ